ncbi:hypothetical protein RhiirA1_487536 [Rhizophagus irregularis]|nr:hypothetical protein RhiirA1_487536 [Rhizophagus irregularis]
MEPLAHEEVAAPTLSCILYPEGVDDIAFRKQLANKGIIVAGALAHLSGKAFRIGHMGNTTEQMLLGAVKIIGESLIDLGYFVDVENAMDTFTKEIIAQTK